MPKFNTFKYGTQARYGRYDLTGSSEFMVQMQNVPFRLKTINKAGVNSSAIIQQSIDVNIPSKTQVRIKSNNSNFVIVDNETLKGNPCKVRIKSLNSQGSPSAWVECSIGKIMPAKKKAMTIEDMSNEMEAWSNRSTITSKEVNKGIDIETLEKYKISNEKSYRNSAPSIDELSKLKFDDILPKDNGAIGLKLNKIERYSFGELNEYPLDNIIRYEMGVEKFE